MFKKSSIIKIPKNIKIYIDLKKKVYLLKNNNNIRLVKINFDIFKLIKNKKEFIYLTPILFNNNKLKKKHYKESLFYLKRILKDISFKSCKKLKLNGIGYKISIIENTINNIIHFKLGYSHSIYFKLPSHVTVKLTKNNVLFLFSNSTEKLSLVSGLIKNCKKPDPYKGKGILYVNEKLTLKVGKKS